MRSTYQLYFAALESNREALSHGLFAQAHQSLSTALYYAFDLRSSRRLIKVEVLAKEQLATLEERFASSLSPLEPEEVSHCRALVELAATYKALLKNASQGGAQVVASSRLDGHVFQDITSMDAHSGTPVSSYAIDGVPTEPATWDTRYITAQNHEETHVPTRGQSKP